MIKRIGYIMLFFVLVLGCKNPQKQLETVVQEDVFQQIKEKKQLKVVFLNNSISYFLYRGTPMGFHYELAQEYAKTLGVRLDIEVASDTQTALQMVENGQCDILASNVNITRTRKKKMLFTSPLFQSNPVLVQNKESKKQFVEDWLDVDTLRIGVLDSRVNRRLVKHLQESLGLVFHLTYFAETEPENLIHAVAMDSIPATFADKITAKVAQTYYSNLDISIPAGLPHNIAWAVNLKAPELLQDIDKWLAEFRKTTKFRRLYTKYFRNKKSILRNKEGVILSENQLSPYDMIIKKEAKQMGWDWRLLSALIYTESRFDPKRVSWAGAFGIMQMMPRTARNFGVSKSSSVAEQLHAGCQYLQYLEKRFAERMEDTTDLKYFALASYNAGDGHIFDAQNLAEKYRKNKDCWEEVVPFLELLKNPKYYKDEVVNHGYFRCRETVNHIKRIKNIYENYKALIPEE